MRRSRPPASKTPLPIRRSGPSRVVSDPGLQTPSAPRVFTVSELCGGLRELLEEELGRVLVVGEVRDLHRARSGHSYFTLADDASRLRVALFRGTAARIPFDPEEGLEVVVDGTLTVYTARGDLQLIARSLEPRGRGALQLAFEQLRARLEAEGLFDPDEKRPLPEMPTRVGVVTSPTGAAVRDVIQVSGHRFPSTPLLLSPTRVQGDGADREIAQALARLSRVPDLDVVLLVRGGGSLEDLMAFNSEPVARAIRACPVPVISGVGHEVDVTIADLAADARAPTPSAAAALALPDRAALGSTLARDVRRLAAATEGAVARARQRLTRAEADLAARSPRARLAARRGRLDSAVRALRRAGPGLAGAHRARLRGAAARLEALSPLGVLGRGYALATRAADGRLVRAASDVEVGDVVRVRTAAAEVEAEVLGVAPRPPEPGSPQN